MACDDITENVMAPPFGVLEGGSRGMDARITAHYQTVSEGKGNLYLFYCDISNALGCATAKTYRAKNRSWSCSLTGRKKEEKAFAAAANAADG